MRRLAYVLVFFLAVPAVAQSYPDVEALLDAVFAKDAKTFAEFLPLDLQHALEQLSPAAQSEFEENFLLLEKIKDQGITLVRSEQPPTLVEVHHKIANDQEELARIVLDRRISDGYESMLRLRVEEDRKTEFPTDARVLVWMRMEEGQWRIVEAQPLEGNELLNFGDTKIIEKFQAQHSNSNEVMAVGSMRTYNTAIVTYAAAYPDHGFPSGLEQLGGEASSTPSAQHAVLVDNALGNPPFEKAGYRFTYHAALQSGPTRYYTLSARPITYPTSGKRSFFTDESGVIRYTEEDREATASDDALQ